MNKMTYLKLALTIVTIGSLIMFVMASCTPKYGCGNGHPKQSWNRMVQRINSPK